MFVFSTEQYSSVRRRKELRKGEGRRRREGGLD